MANKLQGERIEGELKASALRFGIVGRRVNRFITGRLLGVAVGELEGPGAAGLDGGVGRVPGAFEARLAALKPGGGVREERARSHEARGEVLEGRESGGYDAGVCEPIVRGDGAGNQRAGRVDRQACGELAI